MRKRKKVLVAYDISSPKRARSVRAILSEWRVSGQKSVHICWLTRSQAETLFVELCAAIDEIEDRLLLTSVHETVYQTAATDGPSGLILQK